MGSDDKAPHGISADLTNVAERVYDEAVSGTAKELGHRGEELARFAKLVTKPLAAIGDVTDWLDRNARRFIRFVADAKSRTRSLEASEPLPQIAGPVLEGVRWEPEGTPLYEMFAELLASAMQPKEASEVHPSFPTLVRQLSAEEALFLYWLTKGALCLASFRFFNPCPSAHEDPLADNPATWGDISDFSENTSIEAGFREAPPKGLRYDESKIPLYVTHLADLGLITVREIHATTDMTKALGDRYGMTERYPNEFRHEHEDALPLGTVHPYRVSLTAYGSAFARVCVPPAGFALFPIAPRS